MKSQVRANWSHAILICRKCQKKMQAGFGPANEKRLGKALKRRLGGRKGRKGAVGIVEVPCLDICPKQGVVLIDSRSPHVWRIVRPGADLDQLASDLAPGDPT